MNTSTLRMPKIMGGVALALFMALGAPEVSAITFIHEGIVYTSSGNKLETPKLTGKLKIENGTEPAGYSGDIVIPETIEYGGKTYTVTNLKNAFKGHPITSMQMPNSVTSISIGGFADCTELKKVNISTGLTKIDQQVFANCTSLEEISIPANILKLDSDQFKGCTGLKKITIEEGEASFVLEANGFSLGGFDAVEEVYIYRQLETPSSMDRRPLRAAKALKKVVVGGNMTKLYDSFCEGAAALETVVFESAVTSLGTSSFAGTALTELVLPESVTSVPSNCFSGTKSLKKITLGSAVTSVEAMAFRNSALESINLPESLTSVGDMAFQKANLTGEITFPATVTRIGEQAFASNKLTKVNLPAALATFGNGAFMGNPDIAQYTIGAGNENFRTEYYNTYLTSADSKTIYAYAPKAAHTSLRNVTANNLAPYAFYGAKNLESVDFPAVWNYGDYSLAGTGLKNTDVKGAVGRFVLADCPALTELKIIGKEIPYGVAKGCTKLEKVTLDNNITVVKSSAFEGCTSLKEIDLGTVLSIIEADAFKGAGIETIINKATNPAIMPNGVFTEANSAITVKVPVDLVSVYKAAEGWNYLNIAGDANLSSGPSNLGMPAGLYYAGEDGMLHCLYSDGTSSTYDVGGVPHTFQLLEYKNRIYGASAGTKFIYSLTGSVDGDGKLFYISKIGPEIYQATVLDNAGGNAYQDPFGLYIYDETLYVNDRNVCIRKIPANAVSLPINYPSWMENNWMGYYGTDWTYGCIKAGFAITEAKAEDGGTEPLYWVGMKYNGNGIFRFRQGNIGTGSSKEEVGKPSTDATFFKQFNPIITTFAVDSKHGHLYFYVDRMGTSGNNQVYGGLYRVNIADLEANPTATDFNSYNPILVDGAPVAWEGGGANEHVGIPQLALDDTGNYIYWCHRRPADSDVEIVNSEDTPEKKFNGGQVKGNDAYRYAWAETFDASNPRHLDCIKRVKLGEEKPEVEIVAKDVRGYGIVALKYEGSTAPTDINSAEVIGAPEAEFVVVAAGAIKAAEDVNVDIYNAAGLLVARVALAAGESFATAELEAGVYVGVAKAGTSAQTFKFVK